MRICTIFYNGGAFIYKHKIRIPCEPPDTDTALVKNKVQFHTQFTSSNQSYKPHLRDQKSIFAASLRFNLRN